MNSVSFDVFFREFTRYSPFAYQCRPACGSEADPLNSARLVRGANCQSQLINIPSGLGKTGVVVLGGCGTASDGPMKPDAKSDPAAWLPPSRSTSRQLNGITKARRQRKFARPRRRSAVKLASPIPFPGSLHVRTKSSAAIPPPKVRGTKKTSAPSSTEHLL
jgi:hypothetical protein